MENLNLIDIKGFEKYASDQAIEKATAQPEIVETIPIEIETVKFKDITNQQRNQPAQNQQIVKPIAKNKSSIGKLIDPEGDLWGMQIGIPAPKPKQARVKASEV